MYPHEDDDSRGSVGSPPAQGEFDHGSISECEDDLEEEYNDDAENSEAEMNQAASGDEEFDCPRTSPQPLPVAEPISPEAQPPTSMKKIAKRKPAAAKSVPVSRTGKPGHEEQAVSAGSAEKKKALGVPKKRPAVKPIAKGDSVDLAKKPSAPKKKPVSKLKDPMEKASCALPSDDPRNKTKVAVKKSRKLVAAATDKPPVKKGRQDVKHRSEEASSLQGINGMSPESMAAEVHAHSLPQVNIPRKKKTSDETSAKNPSILSSESSDRRFWMETLAGDFKSTGYNALLKNAHFTEQQANVLQQSFYQLCRKLSDISTYSDRFMKTHKCIECEFSISHQCVSIDFTQYVPSSANVTGVTTITPQSTTMCICQFGFFHSHATQPRLKLANNLSLKSTLRMLEHNRSVSVSCPRCHMNVVIKNRNSDVCCDFTNWNSLEGGNRRQFFNSLENRLQTSKMSRPYLNELYTCNRQCCQLFHRCAENAVADNTISMRPH
uniref:Uncharacterized protein N-2 n=1 Tax=Hyposoter didymator TaxID=260305 RepID=D7P5Q7_HYPDD|nr:unknown [Hyposoter didymator]